MPTRAELRRHPRLRWFNIPLSVACAAGAALVISLALGHYSLTAIAISGFAGLIVGIPFGLWATRRIKEDDPNWPPQHLRDDSI